VVPGAERNTMALARASPGSAIMIHALVFILPIALVFTALSLACAVRIGRRRDAPADPFSLPFGEMPTVDKDWRPQRSSTELGTGFSDRELRAITSRLPKDDPLRRSFYARPRGSSFLPSVGYALRTDADGGRSNIPSWLAPISNFLRGGRDASA